MRKILIACHGRMAEGVMTALGIIIGERSHISYINAYVEGSDITGELASYFGALEAGQQVIVLTDLYGGSVNQALFAYAQRDNVQLISGFNLALVLELALADPEAELTCEDLEDAIAVCSKQMRLVKKQAAQENAGDDFDI